MPRDTQKVVTSHIPQPYHREAFEQYKISLSQPQVLDACKKMIEEIIRKYGKNPKDFSDESMFTPLEYEKQQCKLCGNDGTITTTTKSTMRHLYACEKHWAHVSMKLNEQAFAKESQLYWQCPLVGCHKRFFAGRVDSINAHLQTRHMPRAMEHALGKIFIFAGMEYHIVRTRVQPQSRPSTPAPYHIPHPARRRMPPPPPPSFINSWCYLYQSPPNQNSFNDFDQIPGPSHVPMAFPMALSSTTYPVLPSQMPPTPGPSTFMTPTSASTPSPDCLPLHFSPAQNPSLPSTAPTNPSTFLALLDYPFFARNSDPLDDISTDQIEWPTTMEELDRYLDTFESMKDLDSKTSASATPIKW